MHRSSLQPDPLVPQDPQRLPTLGVWKLPSLLQRVISHRSQVHQTCDEPLAEFEGELTFVTPAQQRLDARRAVSLRHVLGPYLSAKRTVVLDIGNVLSIDSHGLSLFLALGRQVEEEGGRLSLCCARPAVRKLLLQAQLHRMVDILNSREEAMTRPVPTVAEESVELRAAV